MTPIDHLEKLRQDYLKEIDLFFSDNNIKEIEFETEENNLNIDPYSLKDNGVLTLIDEGGMDYDEQISSLTVEYVALILTLIQTNKYEKV